MQERRWEFIRVGRAKDYHGVAVHRRHLSRWEQWVEGVHHQYDPVADRQQIMQAKFNGWTDAESALKGTDGKGAFPLHVKENPGKCDKISEGEALGKDNEAVV